MIVAVAIAAMTPIGTASQTIRRMPA
jgi:hypothetical protein